MPYTIRQREGKFAVVRVGGPLRPQRTVGTHDTREEAEAQIAAIHASEGKGK